MRRLRFLQHVVASETCFAMTQTAVCSAMEGCPEETHIAEVVPAAIRTRIIAIVVLSSGSQDAGCRQL